MSVYMSNKTLSPFGIETFFFSRVSRFRRAYLNTGKSYVDVKESISNVLVWPSGGAALTWGICVNNKATLHSLIWDRAKMGVVLQIALQIHNIRENIKTPISCHID